MEDPLIVMVAYEVLEEMLERASAGEDPDVLLSELLGDPDAAEE